MMVCSSPEDCAEIERRHSERPACWPTAAPARQPALGRRGGRDPDREPARGREEGQPGLPRLPGQRQQHHAHARALPLRGRARVDGGPARRAPRRPPAGPPRRRVSVHAGRDVRDRARSDRLRRADGHDARPPGRVRDVLELRRGRPPLGAGALRHDGGAAQARRAVRPDRARPPPRPPALRDRRPLRPRADPGRDLQAAPRLRPRGRGRARARQARSQGSPAATSSTRWSARRPPRPPAASRASRTRRTSPAARWWCSAPATSG